MPLSPGICRGRLKVCFPIDYCDAATARNGRSDGACTHRLLRVLKLFPVVPTEMGPRALAFPATAPCRKTSMPTRQSRLSIQTLLMSICGLMTLMMTATLGPAILSAWRQERVAERTAQISEVTRLLFGATQAFRIERGTLATALASNNPIDADTRNDIEKLRAKSGPSLRAALTDLPRIEIPERLRWEQELRGALDDVQNIRRRADAELAKPGSARDPPVRKLW